MVSANHFIKLNKTLLSVFGIEATLYLTTLISKEDYFSAKKQLNNGFFWNTQNDIESSCFLSPNEQSKALKILKAKNIIDVKKVGIPARNFFKINHENLFKILTLNSPTKKHIEKELWHLKTMPYQKYLETDRWKYVRKLALRKAQYRCSMCGKDKIQLHVHHNNYEHRGEEENHLEDIIVICFECHAKFHNKHVQSEEN